MRIKSIELSLLLCSSWSFSSAVSSRKCTQIPRNNCNKETFCKSYISVAHDRDYSRYDEQWSMDILISYLIQLDLPALYWVIYISKRKYGESIIGINNSKKEYSVKMIKNYGIHTCSMSSHMGEQSRWQTRLGRWTWQWYCKLFLKGSNLSWWTPWQEHYKMSLLYGILFSDK